jgi:DNA anti-recombination protein RmuC
MNFELALEAMNNQLSLINERVELLNKKIASIDESYKESKKHMKKDIYKIEKIARHNYAKEIMNKFIDEYTRSTK